MTDRKIADGCYHTSEFANLPERCDLPNGCHKGHLWIVDGKEQHHPDHTKHNLDRLHELKGTRVRLEMNIETHGIHTVMVGTLNQVHYRSWAPMVAWTVTTDDGTKIQFSEVAVLYVWNTPDITIRIK